MVGSRPSAVALALRALADSGHARPETDGWVLRHGGLSGSIGRYHGGSARAQRAIAG
jgi:hypothetical protein